MDSENIFSRMHIIFSEMSVRCFVVNAVISIYLILVHQVPGGRLWRSGPRVGEIHIASQRRKLPHRHQAAEGELRERIGLLLEAL